MPTPHAAAVEAAREMCDQFVPMNVNRRVAVLAEIITRRYAKLVKSAEWLLSTDNLEGQIAATVALRSALAEVKGEKL